MKELAYRYRLALHMDAPVTGHRFTLRCTPVSDERQCITENQYRIAPADFLSESTDSWGNSLIYGCCRGAHRDFSVEVTGLARVGLSDCVPSQTPSRDGVFRWPTALTAADDAISRLAEAIPKGSILSVSDYAMNAVHNALSYTPGLTTVQTTAAQALKAGQGVCQDYAHVMLSVLRCLGIPCRYVVGMLPGEGRSHAWVEVLSGGCWYGFDPTGNLPVGDCHIKISHGRDARDCAINRGLFLGSAGQETEVSLLVSEIP